MTRLQVRDLLLDGAVELRQPIFDLLRERDARVLRRVAVRSAVEPESQPDDLEPQPQDLDAHADVRRMGVRRRGRSRRRRGRRRGRAVVRKRRRDEGECKDDQCERGETLHLVVPPWWDGKGTRRTVDAFRKASTART
jgi:hypothetical protein